jgi:hypothetical protein
MRLIKKIKQRFCNHEMKHIKQYNISASNIAYADYNATKTNIYRCSKCGHIESIIEPKFIPHYKSRYNDL